MSALTARRHAAALLTAALATAGPALAEEKLALRGDYGVEAPHRAGGMDTPASLRSTLSSLRDTQPSPAQVWATRQWLNDMAPRLARFVQDPQGREALLHGVYHEARLARLPPELVLAVIEVESAFQAEAVSSAGAVGLMQIMPFWIRELGIPADDLEDPRRNLRYGCTILAHYLAVERGDLTRALARYNGSLGETWYPEKVMRAWADHWRSGGSERATVLR